MFIARVTVNPRETAATPHPDPPAPRGRGRVSYDSVLLCMCDFSSVKKEILRGLALNSECENTSSILVGPFCASTGVWELLTSFKLSRQSWGGGGSCGRRRVLMPLVGPFKRKQGEISNAPPSISRRIAHLI